MSEDGRYEVGPPDIGLANPKVVSIQDFLQDTNGLVESVNEQGVPIAITRHGEFLALMVPLAGAGLVHIESDEKVRQAFMSRLDEAQHSGPASAKELEDLDRNLK
ncbi:hypothetical protein ACIBW9_01020 [Streptomyces sp. NPDC049541]|uniref:hypothetical protein n=1 Tax=Streptomyces sp. NPDC049541 TaxID=3365594 RepID=UPI0037AD67B9